MNENDKFHHGFVQNELDMPPPVLQLVLLGPGVSKHKSLWPWLNPNSKKRGLLQIQMTFQTSLKLFSENLTSGQCTKSANYVLAKLIEWLTPTSKCFHVRHLFHCILYMCQVRHVRQATEPKTSIFKTPSSLRSVLYFSNMFSLFTLFPCLSRSLCWCLSIRLSQKVQAQLVNSESK